jgi:hypothetical protein
MQDAQLSNGRTVADALADQITAFNAALGQEIGPVGAVVGATVNVNADSGGSRPGFRDDLAHHSDLMSLGVPR